MTSVLRHTATLRARLLGGALLLCAGPAFAIDVATEAELKSAISGGGTVAIKLTADIALTAASDRAMGPAIARVASGAVITIEGEGHTITGFVGSRIFTIDAGGSLALKNLTLTGAEIRGGAGGLTGYAGTGGGGGGFGGAIFTQGTLTLEDVVVKGCVARGGSSPAAVAGNFFAAGGGAGLGGDGGSDVYSLSSNSARGGAGGGGTDTAGTSVTAVAAPGRPGGNAGGGTGGAHSVTLAGAGIAGGLGGGGGGGGAAVDAAGTIVVGNTGGAGGVGGGGGGGGLAVNGTTATLGGNGGAGGLGGGGGGGGGVLGSGNLVPGQGGLGGLGGGNGGPATTATPPLGGRGGGGAGMGGAVFVHAGTTTIVRSRFENNSAVGGAGTQNGQGLGGAIFSNGGTTTIRQSTFLDNVAQLSPGIYRHGGTVNAYLTVQRVTIAGTVDPGVVRVAIGSAFSIPDAAGRFSLEVPAPNGPATYSLVTTLLDGTTRTRGVRIEPIGRP